MQLNMLDHIAKPGWLQGCSPVAKLGCGLVSVLLATVLWDPLVLGSGAAAALLLIWIGGRIAPYQLLPVLLVFAITAWSLILANNVFGSSAAQADARWNPGLILGLRIANFALWGVFFGYTTHPQDLAHSLMRNAGLSPAAGYGLMTAHRILPLVGNDLRWMQRSLRL